MLAILRDRECNEALTDVGDIIGPPISSNRKLLYAKNGRLVPQYPDNM